MHRKIPDELKKHLTNDAKDVVHLEKLITLTDIKSAQKVKQTAMRILLYNFNVPADETILLNGQKIKQLKLITQGERPSKNPRYPTFSAANIIITLEDNTKLIFSASDRDIHNLEGFLLEHNAVKERGFFAATSRGPDWKTFKSQKYSDPGLDEFYGNLRSFLAELIVASAKQYNCRVKLFVFGTGGGHDARAVLAKLHEQQISAAGIGFDINEEFIKQANELQQKQKSDSLPCVFMKGNTEQLLTLFNREKNNEVFSSLEKQKQTNKNIMLFCGSLTRQVAGGTNEGLYIIQQASRCGDILFASGYQDTLITKDMAERCGWKARVRTLQTLLFAPIQSTLQSGFDVEGSNLYQLEKMSDEERRSWLVNRFDERFSDDPPETTLYLTSSGNPLRDLRILREAKADFSRITNIDLTYCFLLPEEVEALQREIEQCSFGRRPITLRYDNHANGRSLYERIRLPNVTLEFVSHEEVEAPLSPRLNKRLQRD